MDPNLVTGEIIDAAMRVHTVLGPGLLESAYEACLIHELKKRKLKAFSQFPLPVHYDGLQLDLGYRVDVFVEDQVIVELKAVDVVHPVHLAQLMSYLKLSGKQLGLLLNFNVRHLKDGIQRVIL